jgi:branched-chain amino acid transport system substrate-binding protein
MNVKRMLSVTASVCVFTWSGAAMAGPNEIKIGVLTDLTSFASAAMGPGSVLATQIAVEDFGGKVLGKPVEVISADMQSKPDLAVQIARRWYEAEGVDVIVDVPASAAAITIQGMATEMNKMFLGTVAATAELTNKACSANAVHWVTDTPAMARGPVNALAAEGAKSWFLLMPDYQLGKDLAAAATPLVQTLGGKIVDTVYYPTNTTDYAQYLLRAQSSGADVIATGGVGLDLTNQIKQAAEFGLLQSGKQKLAALVMNLSDVHAVGLKTMQGLYIMQEYYWDRDDGTREFAKKFFNKSQKMPNFTHASDYSATVAYLKAVEAAGTADPKTVVARMKQDGVSRFGKPAVIRQDGRALFDMQLYRVKAPDESKYPWDYLQRVSDIGQDKLFSAPNPQTCTLVK